MPSHLVAQLPPGAREEWEVLAAHGEWLRTAHAGAFAPWPHTANERRWLLALHLAHHKVVLEWCERHFDGRRRGAAPWAQMAHRAGEDKHSKGPPKA